MIRHFLRRLFKLLLAIVAIVGLSAIVAVGSVKIWCSPASVEAGETSPLRIDEPGYVRQAANSYFTFPEWYIVYSFEDFGRFLDQGSESGFNYFGQIAGFWRSYCAANRVAGALPGDHGEYKTTINIIGLSYTFEYAIKGIYENTVGRLTEWLRGPMPTAEDAYAKTVLQDYAAFLYQVPWYEYPFGEKLKGLWRDTPLVGESVTRSAERKLSLSAEYLFKAVYARLIALGLAATSAPAELEIMFVVKADPAPILAGEPKVRLIKTLPGDMALLIAPRYQEFTDLVLRLSAKGVAFVEIAGNRKILMSAVVPDGGAPSIEGSRELFALPIDAAPGFSRVGYDVDVGRLSEVLVAYAEAGIKVEHLYDY
jgi:hypothetical protein